jgi:hypothetical protein
MNEDASIMVGTMLLRIALDTTPGRSALGSSLRDSRVWPNSTNVLYGHVDLNFGIGTTMFGFQYSARGSTTRRRTPHRGGVGRNG